MKNNFVESHIIKTVGDFHIWYSKGDPFDPENNEKMYWITNSDGDEIISVDSKKEGEKWIENEIEILKRINKIPCEKRPRYVFSKSIRKGFKPLCEREAWECEHCKEELRIKMGNLSHD